MVLTRGDAPQKGHTPLFIAAFQDNVAAAHVLLEAGANTETTGEVRMSREGEGGW